MHRGLQPIQGFSSSRLSLLEIKRGLRSPTSSSFVAMTSCCIANCPRSQWLQTTVVSSHTHGVSFGKFLYLLKFVCDPRSTPAALLWSFVDMCRALHDMPVPRGGQTRQPSALLFGFSEQVHRCPFRDLFCAVFLCVFCGRFTVLNGPQVRYVKGLSCVPMHKEAVM